MQQEKRQESGLQVSVAIPKKYFSKWLNEQSSIAKLKLRYDFAKAALPYSTMIIIFLLIVIFPRPELMAIGSALITLIFKLNKGI